MKLGPLEKAARGALCMNCGSQDETVVLCHYSGIRQHSFGKGRGIKCDSYFAAPQCRSCHDKGPFAEGYIAPGFEEAPRVTRQIVASEEQLAQILEWHRRRWYVSQGYVAVRA